MTYFVRNSADWRQGLSVRSLVKQVLTKQQNKQYEKQLAARKITYDEWIKEQESGAGYAKGFPGEKPLKALPEGELVFLVSSEGRMSDRAAEICAHWFAEHPESLLAYGDEDIQRAGEKRRNPWFKPDWSPDLLDSYLYFGSVVVLRKSLYDRAVERLGGMPGIDRGGIFERNQDELPEGVINRTSDKALFLVIGNDSDIKEIWKWLKACVLLAGGYERGAKSIAHIPWILYHSQSEEAQRKYLSSGAGSELKLINPEGGSRDKHTNEFTPYISVIIPSRDNPDILEACICGVGKAGTAAAVSSETVDYEIIIVDNGSNDVNRQRIQKMIEKYGTDTRPITYLYHPMEFHFSEMCNLGAGQAKGDLLLFLNDDVELQNVGCMERMAALACREYTGAVGLKLYYPDSVRIQHAGITNLPMGPVHKLQFLTDDTSYYFNSNRGLRNVLAVTAACLMVEKNKFDAAGGFAEELRVAFNDVDLCFTLYEQGYHNVCVNDDYAFHYESLSRGDDEAAEKLNRLLGERDTLYRRHPALKDKDPYYPAGLGREGLDTRIRPAYETAGNIRQMPNGKLPEKQFADYRQDNCLLLRIESVREGIIQGYGVILGDNNACYEREILLIPDIHLSEKAFALKVEEQYRPDLAENMPDQVNVGLCGFRIELGEVNLNSGRYYIGMAVRNRVTGLKLRNCSNRILEIGTS